MNLFSVNKFMTTIDSKFLYASHARIIGEGRGGGLKIEVKSPKLTIKGVF